MPSVFNINFNLISNTGPLHAWRRLDGFSRLKLPAFPGNLHMKVAKLSALWTGRLYAPLRCWVDLRAGRIPSMKNPKNLIGNQTCYLQTCNAVPPLTVLPRTSLLQSKAPYIFEAFSNCKVFPTKILCALLIYHSYYVLRPAHTFRLNHPTVFYEGHKCWTSYCVAYTVFWFSWVFPL